MNSDHTVQRNAFKRRAVQFLHAGGEPPLVPGIPQWHRLLPQDSPTPGHYVPWNMSKNHYRRFMALQGEFLRRADLRPEKGEIGFWGEWEPPTYGNSISSGVEGGPTFIHRPVLVEDRFEWRRHFAQGKHKACGSDEKGCMNTDPFVFGDEFYYALCRQEKVPMLRRLEDGSIILFGSRKGPRGAWNFVVDTVFVVGRSMPFADACAAVHNPSRSSETLSLPEVYRATTFNLISEDADLQFYIGAMYDKPYNGMYSFVPCAPIAEYPEGFPRPVISRDDLLDCIRSGMTQSVSALVIADPGDALRVWNRIVETVLGSGLCLGIRAELPPDLR